LEYSQAMGSNKAMQRVKSKRMRPDECIKKGK